jgi:hypothetical protein
MVETDDDAGTVGGSSAYPKQWRRPDPVPADLEPSDLSRDRPATPAVQAPRRDRPRWKQNLRDQAPGLLMWGAIAAVALGTFMTIKTYRTDHQIAVLVQRGVPVTYHLSTCSGGSDGSTCVGSFMYHGSIYTEPIQGILNFPPNGSNVAAVIDPRAPGASVYVRSAVFGPNAAGRGSWLLGAVLLGALALGLAVLSRNLSVRRKAEQERIAAADA